MRILYALIFSSALLARAASAAPPPLPEGCGEYEAWGRVTHTDKGYQLVVNEGSQSEVRLELPRSSFLRAASHEHNYVSARGKIRRAVAAYRGELSPSEMKDATPDPLHGERTGFRLIAPEKCASPP